VWRRVLIKNFHKISLTLVRYDEDHARFEQQLEDYQRNEDELGCISCYRQERKLQVSVMIIVAHDLFRTIMRMRAEKLGGGQIFARR
jgi:hypothetical protein